MQSAIYYRTQADIADMLALTNHSPQLRLILRQLSRDYNDIATDLECGAIKIVNVAALPQQTHIGPLKASDPEALAAD